MKIAINIKTEEWNRIIKGLIREEWKVEMKYDEFDAGIDFDFLVLKKEKNKIEFSFWLMNALNRQYVSNGYTYSYIYGSPITENFYYPQAGRNVMGSVVLEF